MVFNYAWGTQRPQIRKPQLNNARKALVRANEKLDLDYERDKARVAEELKKSICKLRNSNF